MRASSRQCENGTTLSWLLATFVMCLFAGFMVNVRVGCSSVGIGTRYGLDGPGTEACWGEIFHTRPYLPWAHSDSCTRISGLFRVGVKRPGRGVDHPPASSAEIKGSCVDIPLLPLWALTLIVLMWRIW